MVRNLDIFGEVGYGAAHDVYVPLTVKRESELNAVVGRPCFESNPFWSTPADGKLVIGKDTTEVGDDIRVEFLKKGDFDNPKICAIALVRGTIEGMSREGNC